MNNPLNSLKHFEAAMNATDKRLYHGFTDVIIEWSRVGVLTLHTQVLNSLLSYFALCWTNCLNIWCTLFMLSAKPNGNGFRTSFSSTHHSQLLRLAISIIESKNNVFSISKSPCWVLPPILMGVKSAGRHWDLEEVLKTVEGTKKCSRTSFLQLRDIKKMTPSLSIQSGCYIYIMLRLMLILPASSHWKILFPFNGLLRNLICYRFGVKR